MGTFRIEVRITVIGSVEAVADTDHVIAAVVLVVPDEDVEFFIERDIVNVPQSAREHMQIAAVGTAAQDSPLLKQ